MRTGSKVVKHYCVTQRNFGFDITANYTIINIQRSHVLLNFSMLVFPIFGAYNEIVQNIKTYHKLP